MIETPRAQYAQIAEAIRSRIEDRTYPPGSTLPSEEDFAREFGVTRPTVNRAIGLLRSSGDVKVRRGAGTTVRSLDRIHRDAQRRYAARQEGTGAGEVEVRKLNLESRTEYRQIGQVDTPPHVASILGMLPEEPSLLRSRILYANNEPTQMADSYLPWSKTKDCAALMEPNAGKGGSYGRLAEIGYGPVRFTEDIIGRTPTDSELRALDLDPTQWVFEIRHIAYTADETPIEVCIHVMPQNLWSLGYGWNERSAAETDK